MNQHVCNACMYFNSDNQHISWNEMRIGTIFYQIYANYYGIKTGNQSYFDITNNRASIRSKLIQEGGDYKNFIECSYRIQINGGDLSGK